MRTILEAELGLPAPEAMHVNAFHRQNHGYCRPSFSLQRAAPVSITSPVNVPVDIVEPTEQTKLSSFSNLQAIDGS